ncbi:MAG: transcriptional regulator [Gammaproteobacteria bacterium]|nr:transcriptional regulator [Gammaproteobacteria bacterium]
MNITHHPDTAWLLDYACGTLSRGFDLVMAAHLAACSQCAQELGCAEQLGADLMMNSRPVAGQAPPVAIRAPSQADVLNAWTPSRPIASFGSAIGNPVDLQTLVAQYLECGISALPWRGAGRGLAIAKLSGTHTERLWLLRAAPGTVLPRHTHSGSELTLVLKGAFFNRDRIYAAGDIEDADETVDHQPVVTNEGECICLAVTEGPLRFRALLPRLAQSYLGI